MWAKHRKISWQRPLLTKRLLKGSAGHLLFRAWPHRFPFQHPHLHIFFVFSGVYHSALLCIQSCVPQSRAPSGGPDRQGVAGISLIPKTFTQAGGQCMACKCWGGWLWVTEGNGQTESQRAPGAQGPPPQSRVQGLCLPGERSTLFIMVFKAAACPVTQGPQPRRR